LDGAKPPFLIMHGSADNLVSPVQSKQLYEALRAKGSKVDYVLVEGANHGDLPWYQPAVIERIVGWLKATLGGPVKGAGQAASPGANL
ncbi:MAG: prolyl oligopeptidase family serine peptidase, partial [Comamonas sp.]